MSNSRNTVLLIIIGLLVLGAAAYLFMGQDRLVSGVAADGPASSAEQTFITLTSQLDPVQFDSGILSDPRFTALQDIRTSVVPESQGRQDPFAPLPQ